MNMSEVVEKNLLTWCVKIIDSKLGEDIVTIDLRTVNPYVDYFVIASANNQRKANSIIEELYDMADKEGIGYKPNHNDKDSLWFLCDLGTVVCHVFVNDEREKYNLEGLWKDLPIVKM